MRKCQYKKYRLESIPSSAGNSFVRERWIEDGWGDAAFHDWVLEDLAGRQDGSNIVTMALLEMPDGTIETRIPASVRFVDQAVAKLLMETP